MKIEASDIIRRINEHKSEIASLETNLGVIRASCQHCFGEPQAEFQKANTMFSLSSASDPLKPVAWTRICELCGKTERTDKFKTEYVPDFPR